MPEEFILIPGRTSRQGTALNEGKSSDAYLDETSRTRMNPADMQRLGLADGDHVRMWNETGTVTVLVESGKDELPPGMLFIPYGDASSHLMAGETHGSGMPDSKGFEVFVEKVATE